MAKKFKRYYTGSANRTEPGKGSDRRPMEISEEQFAENWERTFGKKEAVSEERRL